MSPDYIHRTGAPPGFKPVHLAVGAVVLVVWFGVLAFVLTHGRNEASSVDVYSELPPGFTGALAAKGVTYTGLSPVDAGTEQQALAHLPADPDTNGGKPLVFRTTYTVAKGSGQPGLATSALMVVIPDSANSGFHVDFVDPTSYRELESVQYAASAGPAGSATP